VELYTWYFTVKVIHILNGNPMIIAKTYWIWTGLISSYCPNGERLSR